MRPPRRLAFLAVLTALVLASDLILPTAGAQDPPGAAAGARAPGNRGRARRPRARRPPGTIVGWPMPPALIIRQTPETHDEIRSFLRLLRGY